MWKSNTIGKLRALFAISFILSISFALTSYVDSSFIETFIEKDFVGILFTLSSIGILVYISNLPKILEKFGVKNTLAGTGAIYVASIVGLLFFKNPVVFSVVFLAYFISAFSAYLTLDVIIQHYSKGQTVGGVRGFYLTIYNLAFLVAPFISGILISQSGFNAVYILSALLVISVVVFFLHQFKNESFFPKKNKKGFIENFLKLLQTPDLQHVYLVSIMLNFFFAWMTIYMPIYLHDMIGFSWQEIGAMFAIMHIPYVLFEIPWGKIADKILGEKEIMGAGIIIIGLCTASIGFITSSEFWVWACALSLTRLGASMVQVTTESYFFKKVKDTETEKISIFRNASPVALLIAPVVATIFLTVASLSQLFIILGVIVLLALIPNYKLHDTK